MRGGKEKKDSPVNGLADVRKQRHKHSETGDRNQQHERFPNIFTAPNNDLPDDDIKPLKTD